MYQNTERQTFEHSDAEVITYNIVFYINGFQFNYCINLPYFWFINEYAMRCYPKANILSLQNYLKQAYFENVTPSTLLVVK